jgi:hypothetical protein
MKLWQNGWIMQTPSMIFSKGYKKFSSIVLFETIISIALFFVIVAGSTQLFFTLNEKNHQSFTHA